MVLERLGKELLFLDGGMGTLLQERGLLPGELPETWNIKNKEIVIDIHRKYFEAGSDIVLTNTFGANAIKFHDDSYNLKQIVEEAVANVHEGAKKCNRDRNDYCVALDIGPTGKLLEPMGDLPFEEAYNAFAEVMRYGENAGADLIYIETMSDTYELKAAVLAAKENTNLPIFTTMIFNENGKLLTGGDVPSVVAMLEGLRVNAIGMNCGMGPKQMIPILKEMKKYTSLPIIVKANAGLPKQKNGETYYDVSSGEFADAMGKIVDEGGCVIGGCCGTTPKHIFEMKNICKNKDIKPLKKKSDTIVSSYGKAVVFGQKPIIVGERINPTGKSKMKQALKENQLDYLLKEAIMQQEKGADILDVNVGLPDINESEMMKKVIPEIQSVTNLPIQIDTVDAVALEGAMRLYNGKPMVNSVTGKKESMDKVFPLIQKYGGVVVGLTLDEQGIPKTAQGRVEIAKKIICEAKKYGIEKKDIIIDVLTMTISSEPEGAKTTLDALEMVKTMCGVHTILGVSNISFGLPTRPIINANFYTMAMQKGLSAGIINPSSEAMMNSYYAFCALMNLDKNCEQYITNCMPKETEKKSISIVTLKTAIEKGLREEAAQSVKELIKTKKPLDIINTYLIPALDTVGKGFEKGTVFLPQLLMSAEAAKEAFSILKEELSKSGQNNNKKEKVILATVKGDIHDIGKNIVKVLMENYAFDVIDLGKDVDPELIVETAKKQKVKLVGLSALMTTTVVSMEETIKRLRKEVPDCKVMVGGAVLNQEYADMIGADFYGKDAMQSVYYAQKVLKH
ncbi:homocysteine S-methyltransferase family protein [Faecalimonas sp.]